MTSRTHFRLALVASAALLAAPALGAQSNLSTQGFGYSTGQFSSRAQGTDGAVAEMDPLSPVNPATISVLSSRILFFQLEPEYRSVTTAGGTDRTTTARYPNVFGAMPIAPNFVVGFGASTLLDRTATTIFNTTQLLSSGDSVPMSTTFRVDGAMDDLRLAAGWAPTKWLRLGLGAHEIVGHNLIALTESFADTETYKPFTQTRVLGFNGPALSGGLQLVSKWVSAAASMRQGGVLHMDASDTVLSAARVPNRYGGSIAFTGLPNSFFAVRTSHDDWSAMNGLGSNQVVGVDSWDTSVGADVAGPQIGEHIVSLRAGFRDRTLPFEAAGQKVKETSFSGGLGTGFAGGRVLADAALIHANRSAPTVGATEHAWTISIGISVQP
ncbi:MAG TPA: hypothetical protein VGM67_14810 [Gemmatimonadaceae bacterium]|jgi:hypothetical protein